MKDLKKLLSSALILMSGFVSAQQYWITTGQDVLPYIETKETVFSSSLIGKGASTLVDSKQISKIHEIMHSKFGRCGGYVRHNSEKEALSFLRSSNKPSMSFVNYTINQAPTVNGMLAFVSEKKIYETIKTLSSYPTRHYQTKEGINSQQFIFDSWQALAANRSDVKVEFFKHKSYGQPSVILTITGSETPNEVVVIGGHADSINQGWFSKAAPGADDNASGIATITEALRLAMLTDYKPKKTVKFMAYAAEEVGLLGSNDIATAYGKNLVNVVGVVQFDMTGFNGSTQDIVFMTDYTNAAQNKFMQSLIDTYIPGVTWGTDKCGYGCSDHASWHAQGYPASMPFEAKFDDMNHAIHSEKDTLATIGDSARHSLKFAKLATAFMVELAK